MSNVKGKGQRLIPEELLKYLQNQKDNGMNIIQLVDSKGNPRFIEGNGTLATIEGVTSSYNKWSLSGTNLMIMSIITLDSGVTINADEDVLYFELPQWILDKIYPITNSSLINRINALRVNTSGSGTPTTIAEMIYKTNTGIKITNYSKITTTSEVNIQFNLTYLLTLIIANKEVAYGLLW